MPRRNDIRKILLLGSGPIVIGQACEFDYSGTQGAKALKEEGYEVVLVNSNPATIMTDPEFADRTYVEPLVPEIVEAIIARERPEALLPTLGGQTALNLALALYDKGVLEKYGVELLGANVTAIRKAEDRELFKQAMEKIGLGVRRARTARTLEEADLAVHEIGFPSSCGPRSPWAARAAASPTTGPSSTRRSAGRSRRAPRTSASSRRACSAGRSTSSRSSAIAPTTSRHLHDRELRPDGRAHR
jgi:formate-dependent phosphoribosylglycinamide formyltransferase (GAR transformylase)